MSWRLFRRGESAAGTWRVCGDGERTARLRRLSRGALQGQVQVPVCLQAHPELRRGIEQPREPERGIGADAALAEDDLVQAVQRNTEAARSVSLADAERLQELFEQDLARWNGRSEPAR